MRNQLENQLPTPNDFVNPKGKEQLSQWVFDKIEFDPPPSSDEIKVICKVSNWLQDNGSPVFIASYMGYFRIWLERQYPNFTVRILLDSYVRIVAQLLEKDIGNPLGEKKDITTVYYLKKGKCLETLKYVANHGGCSVEDIRVFLRDGDC